MLSDVAQRDETLRIQVDAVLLSIKHLEFIRNNNYKKANLFGCQIFSNFDYRINISGELDKLSLMQRLPSILRLLTLIIIFLHLIQLLSWQMCAKCT